MDEKLLAEFVLEKLTRREIIEMVRSDKVKEIAVTSGLIIRLVGDSRRRKLELFVYENGQLIENRDINLFTELMITEFLGRK